MCGTNSTYLSASTFFGGLPRNRNLLEGISGISSGLTVEKNCEVSSSFLLNNRLCLKQRLHVKQNDFEVISKIFQCFVIRNHI